MFAFLSMIALVYSHSSDNCMVREADFDQLERFSFPEGEETAFESHSLVWCKDKDHNISIDGLFLASLPLRCFDSEIFYGRYQQRIRLTSKIQCIRLKI